MVNLQSRVIRPKRLEKRQTYRPELDGLRALAVISVIINHFNKDSIPSGFLGVDIFFVISGYVITSSLARREYSSFQDFILGFYTRRVKRIIPALLVCILVTSAIGFLFLPPYDRSYFSSWQTGVTALFGFSNFYLLSQATDYFGSSAELNLFTQTWSLGVEEQFYFIFPLLVWGAGFARKTRKGERNLCFIVGFLSTLSLLSFVYLSQAAPPASYFLMTSRFWEMGFGCLLYLLEPRISNISNKNRKPISFCSAVLIFACLFLPLSFQIPATVIVVTLIGALVVTIEPNILAYKALTLKGILYVGSISYSLYLWHWSVITISRWTIGIHWWSIPLQLAVILGMSLCSYRWIETPLRTAQWSRLRWKTILYGFGTSFACAGLLAGIGKQFQGLLYLGNGNSSLITSSRNNIKDAQKTSLYNGENCHFSADVNLLSPLSDACFTNENGRTFYFLGNSHSDHYRTLHWKLHEKHELNIDGVSQSTCIFPPLTTSSKCSDLQSTQWERILDEAKAGDIVFIANRYVISSYTDGSKNKSWIENNETISNLLEFVSLLSKKNIEIVLFLPSPEFELDMRSCLPDWFKPEELLPDKCKVTVPELINLRASAYQTIEDKLSEAIHIYDPIPALCQNDACTMADEVGKPLYYDYDHLSDHAVAQYIYPDFLRFLKSRNLL